MTKPTPVASELHAIARDLGRLRPDWNNPERFFEERHELQRKLQRQAERMEAQRV